MQTPRSSWGFALLGSVNAHQMTVSSETSRRLLWAAVIFGCIGLLITGYDWLHGTLKFATPKLVDQVGMLLLVGALLLTRLSETTRMRIIIFALILIVPSTVLIVMHAL
jgi:hypothetical protein